MNHPLINNVALLIHEFFNGNISLLIVYTLPLCLISKK
ncbi:MAG: hypothetical protein ACI9IJ_000794 [Psychromonas sp.]